MDVKLIGVIVAVIIIVLLVWVFVINGHKSTVTTTTMPATTANTTQTTVNSTNNTSTITTTAPFTNYTNCLANTSTVAIRNGNFSSGSFTGWNASGPGFLNAWHGPLNLTYANNNGEYYGAPWSNYNGRFFATTYQGGTTIQVGNLTSNKFNVTEPYLNFRIVSPQNNLIYIELLSGGVVKAKVYYNTYNGSLSQNYFTTFQNASIPLVSVLCKPIQIRVVTGVVNGASGPRQYQYMAVGDFYLSKKAVFTPGIVVNQTIS